MKAPSELERLRIERDEAIERLVQIRAVLAPRRTVPAEWGLRGQEERLFLLLVDREFCHYDVIIEAIKVRQDTSADNLIKVVLCRLRKTLAPMGFTVLVRYGRGMALMDRERWASMLQTVGGTEQTARAA